MKHKTGLLIILLFLSVFQCMAQEKKKKFLKDPNDKLIFEEAEFFFEEQNYRVALVEYKKLEKNFPDEQILLFRIAVCEQFQSDGIERSLGYFDRLKKENYVKDHVEFYHGRALHLNCRFDEAITELTKYSSAKYAEKKKKDEAQLIISYCQNGKELMAQPLEVKISNVGKPINTVNSEYVPVISTDESIMAFTYRGEQSTGGLQKPLSANSNRVGDYYEDIFFSEKDSLGNWTEPKKVEGDINTNANDACIAISGDGQRMFMFRSVEGDPGTIYECKLNGTTWSEPRKLYGEINSAWWEGSISLSADGKTAFFSSERPGGKGGKDLYSSTMLPDGSWGKIKNLGDSINTPFDDDAPFIHPSGQFILFSSKGHKTMGGYDIFRSNLVNDSAWSSPKNIGYPVNTPGDDIYYVMSGDGKIGYYSSGKAGGFGLQDIYATIPGNFGEKIKMVLVKGNVTLNDKPVESEIVVTYSKTAVNFGQFNSNSSSGKYLVNLPSGKDFNLTFKLEGFVPQVRNVTTTTIEDFFETTIDVQFYTDAYLAMLRAKQDSLRNLAPVTTNLTPVNLTGSELMQKFGDFKDPDLRFKVQIGAYNLPQNFDYASILKLGKVEKQKLDDQITRFTMGNNMTLREAYAFRDKVVAAGITDAFVTAVYKGKRYLIKDLVAMGVFK
ncbi:MAG: TolB family protein [Bacteroidota bacterium]